MSRQSMLLFNDAQQRPLWAWKDRHISDITGKTLHRSRVVMDAPMPRNPGPLTTTLSESGERTPACDPAFVQARHTRAMCIS